MEFVSVLFALFVAFGAAVAFSAFAAFNEQRRIEAAREAERKRGRRRRIGPASDSLREPVTPAKEAQRTPVAPGGFHPAVVSTPVVYRDNIPDLPFSFTNPVQHRHQITGGQRQQLSLHSQEQNQQLPMHHQPPVRQILPTLTSTEFSGLQSTHLNSNVDSAFSRPATVHEHEAPISDVRMDDNVDDEEVPVISGRKPTPLSSAKNNRFKSLAAPSSGTKRKSAILNQDFLEEEDSTISDRLNKIRKSITGSSQKSTPSMTPQKHQQQNVKKDPLATGSKRKHQSFPEDEEEEKVEENIPRELEKLHAVLRGESSSSDEMAEEDGWVTPASFRQKKRRRANMEGDSVTPQKEDKPPTNTPKAVIQQQRVASVSTARGRVRLSATPLKESQRRLLSSATLSKPPTPLLRKIISEEEADALARQNFLSQAEESVATTSGGNSAEGTPAFKKSVKFADSVGGSLESGPTPSKGAESGLTIGGLSSKKIDAGGGLFGDLTGAVGAASSTAAFSFPASSVESAVSKDEKNGGGSDLFAGLSAGSTTSKQEESASLSTDSKALAFSGFGSITPASGKEPSPSKKEDAPVSLPTFTGFGSSSAKTADVPKDNAKSSVTATPNPSLVLNFAGFSSTAPAPVIEKESVKDAPAPEKAFSLPNFGASGGGDKPVLLFGTPATSSTSSSSTGPTDVSKPVGVSFGGPSATSVDPSKEKSNVPSLFNSTAPPASTVTFEPTAPSADANKALLDTKSPSGFFGGATSSSTTAAPAFFGAATSVNTEKKLEASTTAAASSGGFNFGSSTTNINKEKTATDSTFGVGGASGASAQPFAFGISAAVSAHGSTPSTAVLSFGFGPSAGTPSSFGAPAPVAAPFGSQPPTAAATANTSGFNFGGTNTSAATAPAAAPFGSQPSTAAPSTAKSFNFGGTSTSTAPAFGAAAPTSTPAIPAFGTTASGVSPASDVAPRLGSTTSNTPFEKSNSGFSFGATSSATGAGATPFGAAPSSLTPSTPAFGSATSAAPASFASAPGPSTVTGAAPSFGFGSSAQAPTTASTFAFGQQPSSTNVTGPPAFGSGSGSGGFGGNNSNSGGAAFGGFGNTTSSAAATSGFGSGISTTAPSAFGQTPATQPNGMFAFGAANGSSTNIGFGQQPPLQSNNFGAQQQAPGGFGNTAPGFGQQASGNSGTFAFGAGGSGGGGGSSGSFAFGAPSAGGNGGFAFGAGGSGAPTAASPGGGLFNMGSAPAENKLERKLAQPKLRAGQRRPAVSNGRR